MIDIWGLPHCQGCLQESRCQYCAAPVVGRRNCSTCVSLAVNDIDLARRRFVEVASFAREVGLVSKGQNLKFELGSTLAMRAKHGSASFDDHTLGVTRSTILVVHGKERRDVDGVAVVSGLPWPIFDGVVAHELGHVWAARNNLMFGTIEEEGLCETIAYHWYRQRGTLGADRLADAIEKNSDPVYGDGFRMMRKIQGQTTLKDFLGILLSRARL
ncbi:protein DA1 [Nitrospirillum iridis]|uniref:Protein DA1-like domain-containing protein n=1 Tax=Nitrospirillum iridis TaxID=765888 RepID=A0A7X0B460_9PROT|nr:protein DA1 [Nitrospirillum iridis]MBB6255408.1 hypothetical protein [Nitrospirillum iridis]